MAPGPAYIRGKGTTRPANRLNLPTQPPFTSAAPPLRLQQFLEEAAQAGEQGLFTKRGLPRGLRGARWAAGFLKRYRDETVFLRPPASVQRALIALLARDTP
jgi:hypothetical protein